ncbi:MAG: hypothetical protein K9J13_07375 [Saprospiraceae bacterium]|nr:hypothetical protein [Saprospiraceae bacterium]
MDKEYLLKTAKQLNQVSPETAEEYNNKSDELVLKMNEIMMSRPDINSLVGEQNLSMMKDNHANHVRFISSVLKNFNAEILVETISWVFRAYRSHGFKTNYWAALLNSCISAIKDVLTSKAYKEVLVYYEWMQINIPVFVEVSDQKLEASNNLN